MLECIAIHPIKRSVYSDMYKKSAKVLNLGIRSKLMPGTYLQNMPFLQSNQGQ